MKHLRMGIALAAALAGTGGEADESPKSRCSQRSARASSVRIPVARQSAM